MKLALQLKQVCESLSSGDLEKFWSALKQHSFKFSQKAKTESALLLSSDVAKFDKAYVDGVYADSDKLEDHVANSVEPYFRTNLRDLLPFIYNEYVADKASSDVDDEKLIEFFLKKLKNEKIEFEADIEVVFTHKDERENYSVKYEAIGELIIDDFSYDKGKDLLEINRVKSVKINTLEQL